MKKFNGVAIAMAPLLILAACGGTTEADADGDGKISDDEAATIMSEVNITPGEWENTVEFVDVKMDETKLPPEARGMMAPMIEAMKGQKQVVKNCITPEQASKPDAGFLAGSKDANCEYEKFNFSKGKMDIAMACTGKGNGEGDAKITMTGDYGATAYNMDMNIMTSAGEMGDMTITAKTSAKRIGECKG